jgi:DNA-binding CsgD family transcriptional regulator
MGDEAARRSGMRLTVGGLLASNVASSLFALGRVTEARTALEDALGRPCPPNTRLHLTAELAEVEVVSGRLLEAEQLVTAVRKEPRTVNPITAAQAGSVDAQVSLARRQPAEAHAVAAATLTTLGPATEPTLGLRLCAIGLRALAELAEAGRNADPRSAGLQADADVLLQRATELADQSFDVPPAQQQLELCRAEDGRRRGKDRSDDWARLSELPGVHSQPLLEAYLLLRWAETSRRQQGDDDRGALLQRAGSLAAASGAVPLLAEVSRAAALAGVRLVAPDRQAQDLVAEELERLRLTDREREVLDLIGEGRSNRQIARVLDIAEKTVSVHVSHVLRKLGVHTRTEASVLLHRLKAVERGTS